MSDACDYRQMGNQINAIQEKLEAGLESNNPMVVQKTQQALRDLERAYEGVNIIGLGGILIRFS